MRHNLLFLSVLMIVFLQSYIIVGTGSINQDITKSSQEHHFNPATTDSNDLNKTLEANISDETKKGNMMYLALISGISTESTKISNSNTSKFRDNGIFEYHGIPFTSLQSSGLNHDIYVRIIIALATISYFFIFINTAILNDKECDTRQHSASFMGFSIFISLALVLVLEINYDATSDTQSLLYSPKNPPRKNDSFNCTFNQTRYEFNNLNERYSSISESLFDSIESSCCYPFVYIAGILANFALFMSIPRGLPPASLASWYISFLFVVMLYNTRHLSYIPTVGGDMYHFLVFSCSSISWIYALSHYSVLSFGFTISYFAAIFNTTFIIVFLVILDFKRFFVNMGLFSIVNIAGNIFYLFVYLLYLCPKFNRIRSSQKEFLRSELTRLFNGYENQDDDGPLDSSLLVDDRDNVCLPDRSINARSSFESPISRPSPLMAISSSIDRNPTGIAFMISHSFHRKRSSVDMTGISMTASTDSQRSPTLALIQAPFSSIFFSGSVTEDHKGSEPLNPSTKGQLNLNRARSDQCLDRPTALDAEEESEDYIISSSTRRVYPVSKSDETDGSLPLSDQDELMKQYTQILYYYNTSILRRLLYRLISLSAMVLHFPKSPPSDRETLFIKQRIPLHPERNAKRLDPGPEPLNIKSKHERDPISFSDPPKMTPECRSRLLSIWTNGLELYETEKFPNHIYSSKEVLEEIVGILYSIVPIRSSVE